MHPWFQLTRKAYHNQLRKREDNLHSNFIQQLEVSPIDTSLNKLDINQNRYTTEQWKNVYGVSWGRQFLRKILRWKTFK